MPYDAFDALPQNTLSVGEASLDVRFAPGEVSLSQQQIFKWLTTSARAVSVYYGRLPTAGAKVLIVPVSGRGIQGAQAFGYRGLAIRLLIGAVTTEADLKADWKAVHEMVHLYLPEVDEKHLWLAEGLAVYVESIARVQAGHLTAEKIWSDFVRDMPEGLPDYGDGGLNQTHTWGRTYWGGAIFCLLADIEIRKRTANRVGLQQALRGIFNSGGTNDREWSIERITRTGDRATNVDVLARLYKSLGDTAYAPDLDSLWRELGIVSTGDTVRFDKTAPLASITEAITIPSAPKM